MNYDFIDSNIGFNNQHIPNIDMRKFDGKDQVTWILHMEQFFDLHDVSHAQKICIASVYLKQNQFVWYRWICSHKSIFCWIIFAEGLVAHYVDTKTNAFFSQLINLKQKGSMVEHIEDFQRLNIKVNDIPKEHRIDVFISTLKDNIQHDAHL